MAQQRPELRHWVCELSAEGKEAAGAGRGGSSVRESAQDRATQPRGSACSGTPGSAPALPLRPGRPAAQASGGGALTFKVPLLFPPTFTLILLLRENFGNREGKVSEGHRGLAACRPHWPPPLPPHACTSRLHARCLRQPLSPAGQTLRALFPHEENAAQTLGGPAAPSARKSFHRASRRVLGMP